MTAGDKAINYISMFIGGAVGLAVGLVIYRRTMARAAELAREEGLDSAALSVEEGLGGYEDERTRPSWIPRMRRCSCQTTIFRCGTGQMTRADIMMTMMKTLVMSRVTRGGIRQTQKVMVRGGPEPWVSCIKLEQ